VSVAVRMKVASNIAYPRNNKQILSLLLFLFLAGNFEATETTRQTIFDCYVGEWKGTFQVYSVEGKLIKSLQAHHVYRRVDEYTIEGEQTVLNNDGKVEKVKARDSIKNGRLSCIVESDVHGVKVLEGHTDGDQIFWSRKDEDAVESFRERVIDGGKTYLIDGYGIYGKDRSQIYTFVGEYKRVR
jgi:hypothetical protein